MADIKEYVEGLGSKDSNYGYDCLQKLQEISDKTKDTYEFMDDFIEMLDSDNSYVRTRGLLMIAANAKWDVDNKLDECIDRYLQHIMDEKPISSRQCIKSLPVIAKFKPDLKDSICNGLRNANPGIYKDNMASLVTKDIGEAFHKINNN